MTAAIKDLFKFFILVFDLEVLSSCTIILEVLLVLLRKVFEKVHIPSQ